MDSSENSGNGLHFQANNVPVYFNQLGEQIGDARIITSRLIDGQARNENPHVGVRHGNGNGLSLTLGSQLPVKFHKDIHVDAVNSNCSRNGNMTSEREINGGVYDTRDPSNQTLNGMASALAALQNSPYLKPAQQLLDKAVCVSNAVESGADKQVRRSIEIDIPDGRSSHVGGLL